MNKNQMVQQLRRSWKFQTYLLIQLPLAWIMGLRISYVDPNRCSIILPFKRINLNPFKSLYFAVQIASAELSTGLLLLVAINGRKNISMLVQHVEASYTKKAVSDVVFTCKDGEKILRSVEEALQTGEPVKIVAQSQGFDKNGEAVCTALITWSVKKRV